MAEKTTQPNSKALEAQGISRTMSTPLPNDLDFIDLREADYEKMALDDPRLKSVYVRLFQCAGMFNPYAWRLEDHIAAALRDLIRRGDSVSPMLIQLMRDNPYSAYERCLLHSIWYIPSIKKEPYLAYSREILSSRYDYISSSLADAAVRLLLRGTEEDLAMISQLKGRRPYLDPLIDDIELHALSFKKKSVERAVQLDRLSRYADITHLREQDFKEMSPKDMRLRAAYVQLFLKAKGNTIDEWAIDEHLKAALNDLIRRGDKSFDILFELFVSDKKSEFAHALLENVHKIPGIDIRPYLDMPTLVLHDYENMIASQAGIVADFIIENGSLYDLFRLRITAKIRPDLADIILPKIESVRALLLKNAGIEEDSVEAGTHIFGYEIDNNPPGSSCHLPNASKVPLLRELTGKAQ